MVCFTIWKYVEHLPAIVEFPMRKTLTHSFTDNHNPLFIFSANDSDSTFSSRLALSFVRPSFLGMLL